MNSEERRRQIASLTAVHGRVTVVELAEKFGVTAETIRRDLATLDNEGGLYRVHGGAVPAYSFRNESTSIETRSKAALAAKKAIGKAALQTIPTGPSTLFIDAGTTTAMMAEELAASLAKNHSEDDTVDVHIITNSLPIATMLADAPRCDVRLIGGHVRPQSQAVVGDIATRAIGVLRADVAFIGTNALTMQHGLSTPDAQEGAIKRAMVTNAQRVVALCDSTKFGLDYLVSFASINDIATVVTDKDAPPRYIDALRHEDVDVVFADEYQPLP
ncbi:DeoR/GlpR transcriptional regulator [Corynebacterium sp. 320]|uniref:DeoR/GlpR family DNA-binding transcription regulator n=1 Tax=Corynebacterium TaxID=1716 RepID=UPI00125CBBA5|nr:MULTISPECIES: DeoR/GlpR family DNA-binding transcription regulator [Corynebacterium]KAB1503758.1 DeoR/GlpR transcriptional regulator [Corynebacterium sp. 320]KAB1553142.1 DeoR/GlpR transcriptional regulator [Corynebacterium sp. 321]KAB1553640.1 DeoR/GlpR transcriptional regulator [Corynebacterium sp. 319]KAB3527894.1 DeoR/GlpR transcriptional regulator [Corynebacterium sp. 250]KAB3540617.1 DeoR/GlpR transcriptional regulator [Corynebacterium sp. 366]